MWLAGMVEAGPTQWVTRLLSAAGVRTLTLRPARLDGGRLIIDPWDAGHICIAEEVFLRPVAYDLALVPFTPATVLDCGAHIGAFTVLAARRFPSAAVTAFEPDPRNLEFLTRNVRLNELSAVEVVDAAVSREAGHRGFERMAAGRSESGRLMPPGHGADATPVRVVSLPERIRAAAPSSLLLKLDIEGEEAHLIPALVDVLPARCAIFFETHGGEAAFEDAAALLRAHGFTVSTLRALGPYSDGFAVRVSI
jgi:FkbM family methyltransferase